MRNRNGKPEMVNDIGTPRMGKCETGMRDRNVKQNEKRWETEMGNYFIPNNT